MNESLGALHELSGPQMRAMAESVLARLIPHIESLRTQPALGELRDAPQQCRSMREPPPAQGVPLDDLLAPLFEQWVPESFNSAGPGYLAFVPGGGLFPSALADLIADGVNRYTGVWQAAPALVQLEANVLSWFRTWMGFPPETQGILTSGGSMATFSAIVAARHKLLGADLRRGVLYTSDQAHHCVLKAAHLAGVLSDRVRMIESDEQLRMRVDHLAAMIEADRAAGLRPFAVVSSAGTVNTGAIDPLDTIADLCAKEELWHHCDGAYGAFFHMVPSLRPALSGLSRADSLTLDPHKGLFLPYGTGALLIRDGQALRAAHGAHAGYLPPLADQEFYDPSQLSPELSRPNRGLRVWLPLKLYGSAAFIEALEDKHRLAKRCANALAQLKGVEVFAPPALSLFGFRVHSSNEATKAVLDRVNAKRRVMITGCTVGGTFYGRVCVLCFRTRAEHIDACIEDIKEAIDSGL